MKQKDYDLGRQLFEDMLDEIIADEENGEMNVAFYKENYMRRFDNEILPLITKEK